MSDTDEARRAQDARVRIEGAPALAGAVLALVRTRIGWPALRVSQDEAVQVDPPSGDEVCFTYTFDHDFASQYDRTEAWRGVVRLGPPMVLVAWERT